MKTLLNRSLFLLFVLSFLLNSLDICACSRILIADNQNVVMVGRNMDWHEEMDTALIFYPRGYNRYGGTPESTFTNWLSWKSKYATIVAAAYESLTTDGLNEAGLAVHILWLEDADFGAPSEDKPLLSLTQWTQYYLDNFASVEEAIRYTQNHPFDIVPFYHEETQMWGKMHLALEDATGDSAILEYLNGELNIYHDRKNIILTNEPPYEEQLAHLSHYCPFGGQLPLPQGYDSSNRFARGTYFAQNVPHCLSQKALLAEVLNLMRRIAQPCDSSEKTLWHVIADLSNKIYYYQSTSDQGILAISFDDFNLNQSTPVIIFHTGLHQES